MKLLMKSAQPVPVQLNEIIMEYTFTFTEQEANLILNAIQEMPAKLANPLTQKIQQQAKEQAEKRQQQEEQAE